MYALYYKVQMWQDNKIRVAFSVSKYFLSDCKCSHCGFALSNLEWGIYIYEITYTFITIGMGGGLVSVVLWVAMIE